MRSTCNKEIGSRLFWLKSTWRQGLLNPEERRKGGRKEKERERERKRERARGGREGEGEGVRVEVSQNVVHTRTTGWVTSTRPGKLRDFGLQPRRSNPRSRNLFWALGVKSTWFLNFGGQAKCKLVLVVDSWPPLVVFGVVIPLWVKKHEKIRRELPFFFLRLHSRWSPFWLRETWRSVFKFNWLENYHDFSIREEKRNFLLQYL